ncbi:hypothetical protein Cgig2_015942 [Carnegiea gigantea]|uniref:SHSP domain-containing protein n=1 Tax=Carnegiea gigantea TaxID=171969 RepID=A0A9Q1KKK9_9CARY|nr:hypothetical protein Cgig2_015942 [Carnegiea gigantea]
MAMGGPSRVYEDFDPPSDLVAEQGLEIFRVYLPGFKKDQLRVQLTTSRLLKISGERPIGENKWRRFHREFRVPANCDTKEITAKFEGGILYLRLPKAITPATARDQLQDKAKPSTEPPKPQLPQPQPQRPLPEPQPQPQTQPLPQRPLPEPQPQPQAQSQPVPQPQAPLPEPQPQHQPQPPSYVPKKDAVPKAEEEEGARARKEKEEVPGKAEEKKEESRLTTASEQVVAGGGRLFPNLMRPENLMKRVVLPALVLLILGLYFFYMFKSFIMIEDQQESLLVFDEELSNIAIEMAMGGPSRVYEDFNPPADLCLDIFRVHLPELNICANLTCDGCGIQEGSTEGSANNIASPQGSQKQITPATARDQLQDKAKPTTEPPKPQLPQPQPPSYVPKKDAMPKAKEEEEDESARARREQKAVPSKAEEEKKESGLTKAAKQVAAGGSRPFTNLRKPENLMKRVVLPVFVLLILGLYIFYMSKLLTRIEDQQESLFEFDQEQ